jgi:hypothetical protein
MKRQSDERAEAARKRGRKPSSPVIATWQDVYRLLDRDSDADPQDRHWGELPIDKEFDRLQRRGFVRGRIATLADLRHALANAAADADTDWANAEATRIESPKLRKKLVVCLASLSDLQAAIARVNDTFAIVNHHPLERLPPDDCTYEDYEPTELDIKLQKASRRVLRPASSLRPRIALLRNLLNEYVKENAVRIKKPQIKRTFLVCRLTSVWWDLISRAPGRVSDAYGAGRISPFQAFCQRALETLHPLFEQDGALDSAVRNAVKKWKATHPKADPG